MNADVTLMINGTEYHTHTKRLELPAGTYKACAKLKGQQERCRMVHPRGGTNNTVEIPLDVLS